MYGTREIVGLPDNAVKEAKERVRSAIKNNNISFPASRITVNLAPSDIKKTGAVYDLPVLLGILTAKGDLPAKAPQGGRKALPYGARRQGCGEILLPRRRGRFPPFPPRGR